MKMNWLDWTTLILVIIGGINWGFVGLFGFDLVAAIFGFMSGIARIIYMAIGISALYMIAVGAKMGRASESRRYQPSAM